MAASESNERKFFLSRGFGKNLGVGQKIGVVVVDMIVGFTNPSMLMGSDLTREVEQTNKIISLARKNKFPVHFTTISYDDTSNYSDGGVWVEKMEGLKTLKSGTNAIELDERLDYHSEDLIFSKKYASAFFGTALSSVLNAQKIDTLIVTGCTTSGCIRATVVDAVSYGFRPIVIEDAVGDRSLKSHQQSLFDIHQKYGDIMTTSELTDFLSNKISG